MKKLEQLISLGMLFFSIAFNLWLYRLEPTAKIDPNDNTFQYALVDRTNQIWNFAARKCSANPICRLSYLTDHWVPNWAEGYNLPYYYSHLPQILIVASYRLISNFSFITSHLSLFQYYHLVIYLLLSFFPLSVFLALRVIGLPWLTAGLGSLLATQISTDGLYGLDPPSFLWRGYGLSSQLFAMIFLPLGLAYAYRWFSEPRREQAFWSAVFFLFATTAGHLGMGMIAMLSLVVLAISQPLVLILEQQKLEETMASFRENMVKLILLSAVTFFFLSYWVIPILLNDNYHNFSFWDPVWKFNSYGAKEIIIRFLNGDLFDFGRFPVFTILVLIGLFTAATKYAGRQAFSSSATPSRYGNQNNHGKRLGGDAENALPTSAYFPFFLLFLFWLLLYFGRTTWGNLIDLIPGIKEFHLSRFIVGLHLAGLFLAPLGLGWLIAAIFNQVSLATKFWRSKISVSIYLTIGLLLLVPVYNQTIKYNDLNNKLIVQANQNFDKLKPDLDELFHSLRSFGQAEPVGRVLAGRGGSWGKNFRVAETPFYMHLSTYGIPTVLWLPETWSPNSDVEQYFSEDKAANYDLFNIAYVVAPPNQTAQPFWKLIKETPAWKLYQVETSGYITSGVRPAIVSTDKRSYVNLVHQFIQSESQAKGLYPELTFAKDYPKKQGLPNLRLLDEVTYQVADGSRHNLFAEPPLYLGQSPKLTVLSQANDNAMIFTARVRVDQDCHECLVILKQSGHPNWRVTVDGQPVKQLTVFPFYVAAPMSTSGDHEVAFAYEPEKLKVWLLVTELIALLVLLVKRALDKSKKILHS